MSCDIRSNWGFPGGPVVKNPPSVQETRVQSWVGVPFLDLLEKEMATGSEFSPRKSHGQRSLAGFSPWGQQKVGHCLATDHTHRSIYFSLKKKKSLLKPSTFNLD